MMNEVEIVNGHTLEQNEETIRKGLSTFVEVGNALMEIRDERQYIEAGFDRFEDYCRERWDMSYRYADDHIGAARVCAIAQVNPPKSEWVARPLVKLLNQDGEDAVRQAWTQIVEKHDGQRPITGKEVRRFLTLGGVSYHPPGWFELLGEVSDTLTRASTQLDKAEGAINRKPKQALLDKAAEYAEQADDIAKRLRKIAEWQGQ